MTGLRSIAIKFASFAVVSGLLMLLLVNTMLNGVSGDTREFTADFSDVNGLRVGDDIKAAGVRVGQVKSIDATEEGAEVKVELIEEQPLLDNTKLVMRYANLLGQRYIALVPKGAEVNGVSTQKCSNGGAELQEGATVAMDCTDPGFDLTELLNGFRPLLKVLQPEDVNTLASSIVKVLQGEGGTVEQLLGQTAQLSNFLADRDAIFGEVMTNLKPVLDNLAGQGTEITSAIQELKGLMTGLAKDRKAIGSAIDGVSQLVGATTGLFRDVKVPLVRATDRLVTASDMLARSRDKIARDIPAFTTIFGSLGRATSYENSLNVYVCSLSISLSPTSSGINPAGGNGPWSEVCR